jgi:hypothetical protein
MDLVQITEMKSKIIEELRQIDGLKQSMEHTLAGLVEWERYLQSSAAGPVKAATRKPGVVREIQPKPQGAIKTADPAPSERVNKALVAIRGEFTRSQLLAETEGDGKGGIGAGTYSNIFSRLLKKQRIQCVKGSPDQRDSLYMRSGEKKPDQPLLS